MFDNNDLPNGGVQFTISHEVIAFLRWLTEHYPEELKLLAKKALLDGLLNQIPKTEIQHESGDSTHADIIDFFGILELALLEANEEHAQQRAQESKLQPTLDQIDGAFCDTTTVKLSLESATTTLSSKPESSPRELLFQEILKQWRPHNSQLLN
jgi:hypothetical protein